MATRTRMTVLPLAARTATNASPQLTEDCAKSIAIIVNVTAASATGGLTVQLRGYDAEGNAIVFWAAGAALTTTGRRVYLLSPATLSAAANGITAVSSVVLPQLFDINVSHGDSSSYTYSVLVEIF